MAKEKSKKRKSIKIKQVAGIGRSTTISACMIVKDEEELLPQCLESIKDVVDEIIIVDTGSTDRTVEIAKSYGAEVYHHPWGNDFSKHRNQSIGYASGDWIFIIDADEEVAQWDHNIATVLKNENIDSAYVKVENVYGKGEGTAWHNSIRLFRKNEKIRYRGRVHNQLTGVTSTAPSAIKIYHRGYFLDPDKEEEKYLRTKTLLEQEIEADPKNPKFHHYLAVAYLGRNLYEEALVECKEALDLVSSDKQGEVLYLWTRFVAAVCCLNTNRVGEAERVCSEAIRNNSLHLDSYYVLSSLYYSQGNIQRFLEQSDKYLSLLERLKNNPTEFGLMVHNTIMHEWRIRLHRGFAFTTRREKAKANKEYSLALRVCENRAEYYKERCQFSLKKSELKEAQRFLKKALECNPESKELQEIKRELRRKMEGDRDPSKVRGMRAQGRKKTSEPTISLCMIVKDEERLLPQCLESVRESVDEIIIVDTGSIDNTVRIAESYGAHIYFHPWEGDFSKHRNQAVSYATKEWIFQIDADEVLLAGCGKIVREAIKNESIDSVYVTIKSAFDNSRGEAAHNFIRIFRNNGVIRYEGRVHNRIVGERASKIYPITILHEGYNLPPEESRKKFDRTTNLLKKEIEENPQHPRAYHYLAASYLSENMYDEAIDAAVKAITLAEEQNYPDFIYLWSHFIAGISYLKTNKVDEAEEICLRAISKSPKHLDSHYLLTIIYFDKGNWGELLYHSNEYLALLDRVQRAPGEFGPMVHNTINHQWRVHLHRAFAFTELGEKEKATEPFSRAFDLCDDKAEYHRLIALFHMRRFEHSQAEKHLLEALQFNADDAELYRNGAQIYRQLANKEKEKSFLGEAVKREPADIDSAFRLGTIYLQEKCHSEAEDLLKRVLEKDSRHSGALINLGILAKRSSELDNALDYLERALAEAPDAVEALSNLGYVHYGKNNLPEARQAFERLIQIDPTLLDIHLMLSMIYIRLECLELVVKECDTLLSLLGLNRNITLNSLSDLSNLFVEIGKVLLEQERAPLASLAFDVAIHLDNEAAPTLKKIGKIYLQHGNHNASIAHLEKAIGLNPEDWESFSLMADCYARLGAEQAVALCHQKAKELNPGSTSVKHSALK